MTRDKKDRIYEVIKTILLSRVNDVPNLKTAINNAPFHNVFLEKLRKQFYLPDIELPYLVAIASWLQGLNTSLGSGFESIAHILSGCYKKNFSSPFGLKVKKSQSESIEEIIRNLKSNGKPNLNNENARIFNYTDNEIEVVCLSFTSDNYMETDNLVESIEMKSVRPNSGEGRGEKQKILYAKSAFKLLYPNRQINFYVGFPFDPTAKDPISYDKERFFNYLIEFKKFFDPVEVLLGSELWDHLSGQSHTMEEILEVISDTVRQFRNGS